jgi:hypothetical protein
MTRDYDLVMPSIIAVALVIGVRRLLSQENIYTIKLVGRGHKVPKAMHANMFLTGQPAKSWKAISSSLRRKRISMSSSGNMEPTAG